MGRHDHARMVVGFITTYSIHVYRHQRHESLLMTKCTRYNIMWWSLCVWKLNQSRGSPNPFPILYRILYILRHCINIVFILQKKISVI